MLDLLVYCHAFASMRYPHQVATVTEVAGRIRTRCDRLFARTVFRRQSVTCPFDYWNNQGLLCSLDRLDVYVSSMA
jgi:hypothetical protein